MALSMFGVCASATDVKDYPDYDKITYTEAVGVLSGIGVLQGDEGGFRPTEGLTRAEAAKIADYLIGLQDNNVAEGTKFNDIKGHWAEEYITIAESVGLVNGNGDGTFDPEGKLTGYAWEKIVLCALGYSAEYENMLGDKWEGGVAILADKVDLLKDLAPTYDATKAITREEAAQIAYTALFTKTVKYKLSGTTHTLAKEDMTLGMKVFGLCDDNVEFDVFGAPTGRVYRTVKGDVIASFAIEPIASYSNIGKGTKYDEIKDDIEDYYAKGPVGEIEYFVDGVKSAVEGPIGGRGVQVDLYEFDGKFRIVEINTYVAEIGVNNVKIEKNRPNTNGNATPDYISGLVNTAYLAAGEFKDHDVIIYNVGNEVNLGKPAKTVAVNAQTRAAERDVADTVSYNGNVTNIVKNDGYVCFGEGEKVYFDVNAKTTIPGGRILSTAYNAFYYDTYGNVIYVTPAEYDTVSEVGHLYVIDAISYYSKYAAIEDGDLYHPVIYRDAAAQALVVEYTDTEAEIKVVDLAIAQNADGEYVFLDKYGFLTNNRIKEGVYHNNDRRPWVGAIKSIPNDQFAEYYVTEDGEYIIVPCDDRVTDMATKRGNVNMTSNGSFYKDATSSTKISYLSLTYDPVEITPETIADMAQKGTASVKTVVGYKNFEDSLPAKAAFLHEDKDGKADFGAMLKVSATPTTVMYGVFTGAEKINAANGWAYNFVDSNGNPHTLYAECWEGTEWNNKTNPRPAGAVTNFGEVVFDDTNDKDTDDKGKVYKLYLSSENKIVAYNELELGYETIDGENEEIIVHNDDDHVYYGYPTYVDGKSYIELSTKPTEEIEFDAGFGEVPYTGAAPMTLADAVREGKWVAVYTDMVEDGPGPKVERVVFVSVVENPQGGEFEATYTAAGWTQENWVDGSWKDSTPNYFNGKASISEADVVNYYIGKTFKFTYETTYDVNNTPTNAYTKAVTNADPFYFYDGDNEFAYVAPGEITVRTTTGYQADGTDLTGYDYCDKYEGLPLYFQWNPETKIATPAEALPASGNHKDVKVVDHINCDVKDHCGLCDTIIFTVTEY